MFKTPNLTTTATKKALINSFIGSHDLVCLCEHPALHCTQILIDQLKPELSSKEIKNLQLCLGDNPTTKEEEDGGIDIGDLERLFGEGDDIEEEDTTR